MRRSTRTAPKVTWENRDPKDWQVALVPWWCPGFLQCVRVVSSDMQTSKWLPFQPSSWNNKERLFFRGWIWKVLLLRHIRSLVNLKEDLDMSVLPEILVLSDDLTVSIKTFGTCIASINKRERLHYDTWKQSSFTWSFCVVDLLWTTNMYFLWGVYCLSVSVLHILHIVFLFKEHPFAQIFLCFFLLLWNKSYRRWFQMLFMFTPTWPNESG